RLLSTPQTTSVPLISLHNALPSSLVETGQGRVQHPADGPAIGDAVRILVDLGGGADQGQGVVHLPQGPDELHPGPDRRRPRDRRSEEHTSALQSRENIVCRLLLEK